MNYQKIYDCLINRRKIHPLVKKIGHRTDVHHIVPRSWGGNELDENKVRLTWREHFVAHKLLVKLANSNIRRYSMLCAVRKMVPKTQKTSRIYELIKQKWIEEYSLYMLEQIAPNNETRRQLVARKSAATMAKTVRDGKLLIEHRAKKNNKEYTYFRLGT